MSYESLSPSHSAMCRHYDRLDDRCESELEACDLCGEKVHPDEAKRHDARDGKFCDDCIETVNDEESRTCGRCLRIVPEEKIKDGECHECTAKREATK